MISGQYFCFYSSF